MAFSELRKGILMRKSVDNLKYKDEDEEEELSEYIPVIEQQGEENDDEEDKDDEEEARDSTPPTSAKRTKGYKSRQLIAPITEKEAVVNLINGALGIGFLALPAAFQRFGLIYASIGFLLAGVIVTHCLHILVKSMEEVRHRYDLPHLGYSTCMGIVLHRACRCPKCHTVISVLVALLIFVCQTSISSIYVKFMVDGVEELVTHYWQAVNRLYIQGFVFLPLLLLNLVPTIRDLVYCCIIANLSSTVLIVVIVWCMIKDFPAAPTIDVSVRVYECPYFIGVTLFTIYILTVVLLLEGNMKHTRSITSPRGILTQVMVIAVPCYALFAFMCALTYGENTKGIILYNLPITTWLGKIAKVALMVTCFFSHPLVCYEMVDIVWYSHLKQYFERKSHRKEAFVDYIIRAIMVLITVAAGFIKVDTNISISFCGTLFISFLGITFPSLLHNFVYYQKSRWIIVKDLLLTSLGIAAFAAGIFKIYWLVLK